MSRKCLTCAYSNKIDAEREYLQGKSISEISRKYGLPYDSLSHHMQNHLSRQMVTAFKKQEAVKSLDMMNEFTDLMTEIKEEIQEFRKAGKDAMTLGGQNTLIRLYSVMCQFASVFYQQQANEHSQDRATIEDEIIAGQREALQGMLDVLTDRERSMLTMLNAKIIGQNRDMILIPDDDKTFDLKHSNISEYIDTPAPEIIEETADKEVVNEDNDADKVKTEHKPLKRGRWPKTPPPELVRTPAPPPYDELDPRAVLRREREWLRKNNDANRESIEAAARIKSGRDRLRTL